MIKFLNVFSLILDTPDFSIIRYVAEMKGILGVVLFVAVAW